MECLICFCFTPLDKFNQNFAGIVKQYGMFLLQSNFGWNISESCGVRGLECWVVDEKVKQKTSEVSRENKIANE